MVRKTIGAVLLALAGMLLLAMIRARIADYAFVFAASGAAGLYLMATARRRERALQALRAAPDAGRRPYSPASALLLVAGVAVLLPILLVDGPDARNLVGGALLPIAAACAVVSLCLSFRALEEGRRSLPQYVIFSLGLLGLASPWIFLFIAR